ncbi:hypothetical protein TNCV_2806411 [Trichonephila clavipes]|nr:hypothetical protein TNCV_2806411 [Trichonephila clavipes]
MRKCIENVMKNWVECKLAKKRMQEENGRTYHRKREKKAQYQKGELVTTITKCRNKENHITDEANIKATPRTAGTLKDTLTVFRKHAKKPKAHLLLLA